MFHIKLVVLAGPLTPPSNTSPSWLYSLAPSLLHPTQVVLFHIKLVSLLALGSPHSSIQHKSFCSTSSWLYSLAPSLLHPTQVAPRFGLSSLLHPTQALFLWLCLLALSSSLHPTQAVDRGGHDAWRVPGVRQGPKAVGHRRHTRGDVCFATSLLLWSISPFRFLFWPQLKIHHAHSYVVGIFPSNASNLLMVTIWSTSSHLNNAGRWLRFFLFLFPPHFLTSRGVSFFLFLPSYFPPISCFSNSPVFSTIRRLQVVFPNLPSFSTIRVLVLVALPTSQLDRCRVLCTLCCVLCTVDCAYCAHLCPACLAPNQDSTNRVATLDRCVRWPSPTRRRCWWWATSRALWCCGTYRSPRSHRYDRRSTPLTAHPHCPQ